MSRFRATAKRYNTMKVNRIRYDRDTGELEGSLNGTNRRFGKVDVVELDLDNTSTMGKLTRESTILRFEKTVDVGIEQRTYATVGICQNDG